MTGCGSLLVILLLSCLALATAQSQNTKDRTSQAYTYDLFPNVFNKFTTTDFETPFQIRAFLYLNLGVFNAWAPYHPTAVDIFGRSCFRRPTSEHTIENKNTAIYYALLRIYQASPVSFGDPLGEAETLIRDVLAAKRLDPDDMSLDMTTPIGIGNRAGIDLGKLLLLDNWNADGSRVTDNPAYAVPFSDYTSYTPKNSPWEITHPFSWQPVLESNHKGFFFRQEHVSPYAGQAMSFTETPAQMRRRRAPSQYSRNEADNLKKLRRNARKVFKTSQRLTEEQRLLAELFDNKVFAFIAPENPLYPFGTFSIATAVRFLILGPQLDLSLDDDVNYGLASNIVTFDAIAAVWKEKVLHDNIRPTGQTMEMLFGDREFKVWGGPDSDKPTSISAKDWKPYIRTMPHSEYPSGTACLCEAFIEQALEFTEGRDDFDHDIEFFEGTSSFYPGKVPSKNVTISVNKLTEWNHLCGESRLWSGVHFEPSISAGRELCKGLGRKAQNLVDNLVAGKPDMTWLRWLPDDVERFWEDSCEE